MRQYVQLVDRQQIMQCPNDLLQHPAYANCCEVSKNHVLQLADLPSIVSGQHAFNCFLQQLRRVLAVAATDMRRAAMHC